MIGVLCITQSVPAYTSHVYGEFIDGEWVNRTFQHICADFVDYESKKDEDSTMNFSTSTLFYKRLSLTKFRRNQYNLRNYKSLKYETIFNQQVRRLHTLATQNWNEYSLLDSGEGRKLECFGSHIIDRPEPKAQ